MSAFSARLARCLLSCCLTSHDKSDSSFCLKFDCLNQPIALVLSPIASTQYSLFKVPSIISIHRVTIWVSYSKVLICGFSDVLVLHMSKLFNEKQKQKSIV